MTGTIIELPWPPASLSGHAKGHWRGKSVPTAKHRKWAHDATLAARIVPPDGKGDIHVSATFYPPDRRSDRGNFPNRIKPYWDGIADALGVNDRRFLPTYHFAEPANNPRVVFVIYTQPLNKKAVDDTTENSSDEDYFCAENVR